MYYCNIDINPSFDCIEAALNRRIKFSANGAFLRDRTTPLSLGRPLRPSLLVRAHCFSSNLHWKMKPRESGMAIPTHTFRIPPDLDPLVPIHLLLAASLYSPISSSSIFVVSVGMIGLTRLMRVNDPSGLVVFSHNWTPTPASTRGEKPPSQCSHHKVVFRRQHVIA
ncbi:hypothetical protein ACLOJK_030217 [Asimina triloba]